MTPSWERHCAVTGLINFYDKTPDNWFCKKQVTSETVTYRSKFISCCTCFEQVIDYQNYLCHLGAKVCKLDFTFGDIESQVKSVTVPHAKLRKHHNILSFHFVGNVISHKYINLQHIRLEFNQSDALTKHRGYHSIWNNILKPIFHSVG